MRQNRLLRVISLLLLSEGNIHELCGDCAVCLRKDMIALYQPYYEMGIHQFVDKVNAMYKSAKSERTLKLLR